LNLIDSKLTKYSKEKKTKVDLKTKIQIDFKGSILLAITITSFLLALTFLESAPVDSKSNINNGFPIFYSIIETVLPFIISGIISLILLFTLKNTQNFH
jgi:hypothetical protein